MAAGKSKLDLLWEALRAARRPISAEALANVVECTTVYSRRALAAWGIAGYIDISEDDAGSNLYCLTDAAPEVAPSLQRRGNGFIAKPLPSDMTADEFSRLRRQLGMPATTLGIHLGLRGHPSTIYRKVQGYEHSTPIPRDIADMLRRMVESEASE